MKTQLTQRLLADITKDISGGRPIWGLLRANEYLEQDSPIRKALAFKAKTALRGTETNGDLSEAVELILSGATLLELPETLQDCVRANRETSTRKPKSKFSYVPVRSNSFSKRKATLRALRAA